MKIVRDGKEYELTEEELSRAFWEKDDRYSAEDILSRYDVDPEKLPEVIREFNRNLDCNDTFWDCYWEAIDYTAHIFGLKEKED